MSTKPHSGEINFVLRVTHLHESPAKERRNEQGKDIESQARNLSVRTILPVVREEVDATCTVSSQCAELTVEYLGVVLIT